MFKYENKNKEILTNLELNSPYCPEPRYFHQAWILGDDMWVYSGMCNIVIFFHTYSRKELNKIQIIFLLIMMIYGLLISNLILGKDIDIFQVIHHLQDQNIQFAH